MINLCSLSNVHDHHDCQRNGRHGGTIVAFVDARVVINMREGHIPGALCSIITSRET